MKKIVRIEKVNGLGAAVWAGPVDTDYGKAAMQAFIEEHPHNGWALQFEDTSGDGKSVHVLCDTLRKHPGHRKPGGPRYGYPASSYPEPAPQTQVVEERRKPGCSLLRNNRTKVEQ